jgi:hypothetical protein
MRKYLPGAVLDEALLRLLPDIYSQKESTPPLRSFLPGVVVGRGRAVPCTGHYIVDAAVILPRMIRTKEGREVLQHQLIKEREDADSSSTG